MTHLGKLRVAGGFRRLPEWVAPIGASLCLHLLLLSALTAWHEQPREVVLVNLLEARLLPDNAQKSTATPPATTTSPPQPEAGTHTQRQATALHPTVPARPTQPLATVQTTVPAPPTTEPTGFGASVPTAGGPEPEVLPPTMPPAAGNPMAVQVTTAKETVEQRYIREQFAYIRERVMERLTYPPIARRQRWTGQVKIEFTVCADGTIEGLRVASGSGRALLDQQALRAVQAAAPFPAPPVPAIIILPVVFTAAAQR